MRRELIGETLLEQFQVENFVAAGGMATIFRVWDLKRNVPLAMKVLQPELAEDPAFMARFQREARSLEALVHPHIVPFYGLFRDEDLTFLLERYIDGPSLDEVLRLRAGRPLPISDSMVYFKALYTSLGYGHAQGIIHCDVKPGNVLIDQGGHVYLTDFGIARYADAAVTTASAIGTPLYMAPEQIRGERVSPRTDVYSLGVLMFELLTGRRPFRGEGDIPAGVGPELSDRIRYQQLYQPPSDPSALNPAIPVELSRVLLHALQKDPDQRYPDVQAMAADVSQAVGARLQTLPDRVPLAREMAPAETAGQYDPAGEAFGLENDVTTPAVSLSDVPDTLPGVRPSPGRALPAAPPRMDRRLRLLALLAGLALILLCGVASVNLIRQRLAASAPGLPPPVSPTQTQPGQPTKTAALHPSPTASGLSNFAVSGKLAFIQRQEATNYLLLLDAAQGEISRVPFVVNVGTHSNQAPQWSPDGSKLTWIGEYHGRQHVVVMDMQEREPYQLPAGEKYSRVSAPAWLPDGKRVSFWAFGGGQNYLVTADATTGNELEAVPLPVYRNLFVWNFQNGRLAFVQGRGSNAFDVHTSNAADVSGTTLNVGGSAFAPAWSRDGEWLAFQADVGRSAGEDEIWVARPDGSDLHQITHSPQGAWARAPSWSPDGKRIAFVSNRSGSLGADYGELFVVDLGNGQVRQMTSTNGSVYDWRPAWQP